MSRSLGPVDAKRLQNIERLFDQALEVALEDRNAWLKQACVDDAALLTTLPPVPM